MTWTPTFREIANIAIAVLNIGIDALIVSTVGCLLWRPSWIHGVFTKLDHKRGATKDQQAGEEESRKAKTRAFELLKLKKWALLLLLLHSLNDGILETVMLIRYVCGKHPFLDWNWQMVLIGDVFAVVFLTAWLIVFKGRFEKSLMGILIGGCATVFVLDVILHKALNCDKLFSQPRCLVFLIPSMCLNVLLLIASTGAVTFRYGRQSTWFIRAFLAYSLAKVPAYLNMEGADAAIYFVVGVFELIIFVMLVKLFLSENQNKAEPDFRELFMRETWQLFPKGYAQTLVGAVGLVIFEILIVKLIQLERAEHPQLQLIAYMGIVIADLIVVYMTVPKVNESVEEVIHDDEFWQNFIKKIAEERAPEDPLWDYKEVLRLNDDIQRDTFARDFAAFANADGGVLIAGVKDKPRDFVGLPLSSLQLEAFEQLAHGAVKKRIDPPPPGNVIIPRKVTVEIKQKRLSFLVVVLPQAPFPVAIKLPPEVKQPDRYIFRQRQGSNNVPIPPSELYIKKRPRGYNHRFILELKRFVDGTRKPRSSIGKQTAQAAAADEGVVQT